MGSYRRSVIHDCARWDVAECMSRGKATCGDIDIMITRSPDDGKTHAGMSPLEIAAARIHTLLIFIARDSFQVAVRTALCRHYHRRPLAVVRCKS
jgi:hypothetical protein